MGGETDLPGLIASVQSGPSPRGRGNRRAARSGALVSRAIPAWAGKPWPGLAWHGWRSGHPRVGGETYILRHCWHLCWGPSPRGRGNPVQGRWQPVQHGAIPAWAGKPKRPSRFRSPAQGHPRVGGETTPSPCASAKITGPSPRGRGNQAARRIAEPYERAIPAWAGKPLETKALSFFNCQTTLVSPCRAARLPDRDQDAIQIREAPRRCA